MDLFCNRCGYNNRDGSIFCIRCGQRLAYVNSSDQACGSGLNIGSLLQGRYRIIKRLGRGGMGVVYLANDNRFSNRFCVVKEMMEYLLSDYDKQKAIARFNQEADLLASISHPNIPQVYDRFSEENRHYLVMEFVEGMDFKELLQQYTFANKKPLPEEHVTVYMMQLCGTLRYLHNHKPVILHRDIKPSNILLTCDGKAKLIDFGIAKAIQTNTMGTSVGTQGYAAPEQYRGLADSRTDIYALGATVHHLLTGRDPQHETPFDYPPAVQINCEISHELSDIIGWMLQTDINKRPQHVDDIMERIKKVYPDIDQKVLNYPGDNDSIINTVRDRLKMTNAEPLSRIFCIYCGYENKTEGRFCCRCGKPLGNAGYGVQEQSANTGSYDYTMIIPGSSCLAARYPGGCRECINVPSAAGVMKVNVVLENYMIDGIEYVYITERAPSISGRQAVVYSAHRNPQGVMQYIKPVVDASIKERLYIHWMEIIDKR